MFVLKTIAESIGLIIGSITAGILCSWLLWSVFKLVRHPELGPPLMLIPAALAVAGRLPASPFLVMTLIFSTLAVVPFCFEGIAWRKKELGRVAGPASRRTDFVPGQHSADPTAPHRRYPAITGCISEKRDPDARELKKVAARILMEGLSSRQLGSGIAGKRAALRLATVALKGSQPSNASAESGRTPVI